MSKRTNDVELCKDNYEGEINKETDNVQEDFQRADETQLRARRIVKTTFTPDKASGTTSNDKSSNSNPFANIQLISSAKSTTRFALDNDLTSQNTQSAITATDASIAAAREHLTQQFLKISSQYQNHFIDWTKAIRFYLACQDVLDNASAIQSIRISNEEASVPPHPPIATVAEISKTNPFSFTATTTTNNMFGNFAPPPVAAPATNVFGSAATPTPVASNDNDEDVAQATNEPNIYRDADPDWKDLGEYEKIRFYKTGDDGKFAKYCFGTLRLQQHTSQSNISRMILRSLNGSEVLINIRIDHGMEFKLVSDDPQKKIGKIYFKGINSIERGSELFIMKCSGIVADQLCAQLKAMASKHSE